MNSNLENTLRKGYQEYLATGWAEGMKKGMEIGCFSPLVSGAWSVTNYGGKCRHRDEFHKCLGQVRPNFELSKKY